MRRAVGAGLRRLVERCQAEAGLRGEGRHSRWGARHKGDVFQGRPALLCRCSRQRWNVWDAWGADRQGTGQFRERHRARAGDSCQSRLGGGVRRSGGRVECRPRQSLLQRWPEDQPPGAQCRPAEARFAASPCAVGAVLESAQRARALSRGERVDAQQRQRQGRRNRRRQEIPARAPGRLLQQTMGLELQRAPQLWRPCLWRVAPREPRFWRQAQRVQEPQPDV